MRQKRVEKNKKGVAVSLTAVLLLSCLLFATPNPLRALLLAWSAAGSQVGGEYGYALATVDVNGDNFDDLIVGAPRFDNGQTRGGAAFLFHGSAGGLNSQPAWSAGSDLTGARYGFAVAVGDVNGDSYGDVLIGAYRSNQGQPEEGRVYLYLGSAQGLPAAATWTYESNQKEAQLGYSIAGGGDVNGDGFDDVLVGARWYSDTLSHEGAAFLFLGSAAGLSGTPDWTAVGGQTNAAFGTAIALVGDVNGDGYDDVAVGAPFYDGALVDEGAVFLFLGGSSGPGGTADQTIRGGQANSLFGAAITAADFNQDGQSDMMVGAPYFDGAADNEGAVFLYPGSGQGVGDTAVWSAFSGQTGARFGTAVSAGHVNGDALPDLLIGAPQYTHDQSLEGSVFLYLGISGGISANANWIGEGNKAESAYGFSADLAGDVNGDGYNDPAIGAPQHRINRDIVGRAFVYFGAEQLADTYVVYLPVIDKE
ncbi:MAG: FG-GAP repeat protein [Chloroflexi bacterium]|nr:FG-GAP repeat protein [Chloroflexota bacterium]